MKEVRFRIVYDFESAMFVIDEIHGYVHGFLRDMFCHLIKYVLMIKFKTSIGNSSSTLGGKICLAFNRFENPNGVTNL